MHRWIGFVALLLFALRAPGQKLQFAGLANFGLENGDTIRDCRFGFRRFGTLNNTRSDAILFLTYPGCTSDQMAAMLPYLGLDKYHVSIVDALGNGASSSPLNSHLPPRMRFPQFTVGDMAEKQHDLVLHHLGISHPKAIMGVSMGGIQTFQMDGFIPGFHGRRNPDPRRSQTCPLFAPASEAWNGFNHGRSQVEGWELRGPETQS